MPDHDHARPPASPERTAPPAAAGHWAEGAWRVRSGPTPGPTAAQLAPLLGRQVVVLGFGNQGRAHALNLADSGVSVAVALRSGSPRWADAAATGLAVGTPEALLPQADLVILALPEPVHRTAHDAWIAPFSPPESALGVLHGHSIHFGLVVPGPRRPVLMVAPKGPGATLRERYLAGTGIPALLAVRQPGPDDPAAHAAAWALAEAWAHGLGCGRSGLVETTFAAETVSDLFGEQTVLCGGVTALLTTAFEVLVEAGAPPELAYLECVHELKQVVDLLYASGPAGMRRAISTTAAFGALEVDAARSALVRREQVGAILDRIISGEFAERMADDDRQGGPWRRAAEQAAAAHPIEAAGRAVRALMPWLDEAAPPADPTDPPRFP
jgi:ketol-acid reductoisomerase